LTEGELKDKNLCLHYKLVARILSSTANGSHFTTVGRTTNDWIYKIDGMQESLDAGVRSISKYNSRGCAVRLNKTKIKDLSAIAGRHKNTTAVFYILQDDGDFPSSQLQQWFWTQQYQRLWAAMDIVIATGLNALKFSNPFEEHRKLKALNTWIPCGEADITWTKNLANLSWEWKVTIQLPVALLSFRS